VRGAADRLSRVGLSWRTTSMGAATARRYLTLWIADLFGGAGAGGRVVEQIPRPPTRLVRGAVVTIVVRDR
jgi:hypothetical protein